MTIEYKSDIYRLSTTNLTTTLTVNATTRFIVKEISVSNIHNNTVDCNFYLNTVNGSAIFYSFRKGRTGVGFLMLNRTNKIGGSTAMKFLESFLQTLP